MALPDGLASRHLVMTDAPAVTQLIGAAEVVDAGQAAIELADIEGDWQRPSFDLSTESVGVFDGDVMVAAADVFKGRRAEAAVHPDHRGRGVGAWLAGWVEDTARARGSRVVGQTAPADSSPERFFRARGYREGHTSWVLQLPEGVAVAPQPLAPGHRLRAFTAADEHTAYRLIEDAFNEWPGRDAVTFEDWAPGSVRRSGFEPWQIRFAVDDRGEDVGVCFVVIADGIGHVAQIAVRRDRRGRGLARALLADAFGRARERGATVSELSTDSRTGALGLYEHVGMRVAQTWRRWETDL